MRLPTATRREVPQVGSDYRETELVRCWQRGLWGGGPRTMLSRSERLRLWWEAVPYTMRRLVRPFARVGLGSWPGALLGAAVLIVLLGMIWVVMIIPAPGWPPFWADKTSSERIQIAGALLSGVAVTGVVFSLAAGVAEINKVFPRQRIHFAVNCIQGDLGPCSMITIVNGNAFVQFPRVEASAELIKQDGSRQKLQIADPGPWTDTGDGKILLEGMVLHPNQWVRGGSFRISDLDPAHTVEIAIVWSSERSTPSLVKLRHEADTRMGDYR